MCEPDSEDELNGYFGMEEHDNNRDNCNKERILRAKGRRIKKTNKNKPFFLTVKWAYLKVTHTKKSNKEDKYETMVTSYKKDKEKDEEWPLIPNHQP